MIQTKTHFGFKNPFYVRQTIPLFKHEQNGCMTERKLTRNKTNKACSRRLKWSIYLQREVWNHLSLFQVGLSIQVCRLDVTNPMGVRGIQQQQVSRDDFITGQMDKVSDPHILPAPVQVGLLLAEGQGRQWNTSQYKCKDKKI